MLVTIVLVESMIIVLDIGTIAGEELLTTLCVVVDVLVDATTVVLVGATTTEVVEDVVKIM